MRATANVCPVDLQNILVLCGVSSRASYIRRRGALARAVGVFFFRGTHKVRDDLQLSHFVG